MRADRRTVIKAGAFGGAAVGAPLAFRSAKDQLVSDADTLLIFDSRIPESRSLASELRGEMQLVDIAKADEDGWPMLRGALPNARRIEGLTGWSDWVSVRGELEARGWRFRRDNPVVAPISGKTHLFRWTLEARA